MKLSTMIILNMIIIFVLYKLKKNLHPLEILTYYFLGSILNQNFLALQSEMGLHVIEISNQLNLFWITVLNRLILVPVTIILFMNFYVSLKKRGEKMFIITVAPIFLIFGDGWLNTSLNAIHYLHWRLWWNYPFMLGIFIITIVFMKRFRNILRKVGINL